jgi:hypothetical protein
VLAAAEAQARARRLLAAHLTARQRVEYAATGGLSIVKRGLVWGILLRQVLVVLPFAPLIALPASRTVGVVLLAAVAIALAPFWISRFRVASMRRRDWFVSGRSAPVLRVRGRSMRFCVRFTEDLPAEDRVLAWKNLIELSEAHFLKTANAV